MKTKLYLFISLSFLLFSCDALKQRDYTEEKQRINAAAVKEGIAEIEQAKEAAKSDIEKKVTATLDALDEKLKAALDSIQSEVSITVRETITQEAEKLQKKSDEAHSGCLIGILGVIVGVLGFIRGSKRRIEEISKDAASASKRVDRMVRAIVEDTIRDKKIQQTPYKGISREDVERIVATQLKYHSVIKGIDTQIPARQNSGGISSSTGERGCAMSERINLYARDSQTKTLTGVGNTYDQGKTLYQITLDKPDSNVGIIEPCLDHNDAKRRLLQYREKLLVPVCKVTQKNSDPKDVVVVDKGKVEKVGVTEWNVIKEIIIELQ